MSVYSYKCPSCSASLMYDPSKEKLSCDFCGSSFTKEEIDKYLLNNPDKIESFEDENKDNNFEADAENIRLKGYSCSSCGAEVVTDDTTLTTFCYYCHSPVNIIDRAMGSFKPDMVVPFKIDKKLAEENFLNWASHKRYVPKSFYSESQLEKITGMYLPYWSVDVKFNADISGTGYKKTTSRSGNTEITDTSTYKVDRKGEIIFNDVNEAAYSKIERDILNSIAPYDLDEAQPFNFYYLNGFFSEIYDVEKSEVEPKINNRIKNYKDYIIRDAFSGYSNYKIDTKELNETERLWSYVLLPTWILTYRYNSKTYVYTMNGQTSEAYGELPVDKGLMLRDALVLGLIAFILALLGGYFLW